MKNVVTVVTLVLGMAIASTAAADGVSRSALAKMGLSGMQQVSDVQGMQVRGEGVAPVAPIIRTVTLVIRKDLAVRVHVDVTGRGAVAESLSNASAEAYGRPGWLGGASSASTYTVNNTYANAWTGAASSVAAGTSISGAR